MPSDHANNAAAVAVGWKLVQLDRGATANPRFYSHYEKMLDMDGAASQLVVLPGYSNVDQATADAQALLALNGFRQYRYGRDAANINKRPRVNAVMTADVN